MAEEKAYYFNEQWEMVDEPVSIQQLECDTVIEFCATAIVPDGFTFVFTTFDAFCVDFSDLSCVLETVEEEVEIPNPCGATLVCPVFIEAVRAVGCVRIHINANMLQADTSIGGFGECNLSFNTTVCVNQVIGFVCNQGECAEDCFVFAGAVIFSPTILIDPCGRQVVSARGNITINFNGC